MAECKFLPALSDSLEITASSDPPQVTAFVDTMDHVLPVFDHLGEFSASTPISVVLCLSLMRYALTCMQGLFSTLRKRT
jgi:hypothetical protein